MTREDDLAAFRMQLLILWSTRFFPLLRIGHPCALTQALIHAAPRISVGMSPSVCCLRAAARPDLDR